MNKLTILLAVFLLSACGHDHKKPSVNIPQVAKKTQLQIRQKKEEERRSRCESANFFLSKDLDSLFAGKANAIVPGSYDDYSAISMIKRKDYEELANLEWKSKEIDSALSKSDAASERKLLALENESSGCNYFKGRRISHVWQVIDADNSEDRLYQGLQATAKKNGLGTFLANYKKKFDQVDSMCKRKHPTVKNCSILRWTNLRAKSAKKYTELKLAIIAQDSTLKSCLKDSRWRDYVQ
ncbi:MAG: hypothetical protein JWM20_95 [Patescibacteria group bacterium]|nr:hypothetical protein [Patescibacteria group bacterium]